MLLRGGRGWGEAGSLGTMHSSWLVGRTPACAGSGRCPGWKSISQTAVGNGCHCGDITITAGDGAAFGSALDKLQHHQHQIPRATARHDNSSHRQPEPTPGSARCPGHPTGAVLASLHFGPRGAGESQAGGRGFQQSPGLSSCGSPALGAQAGSSCGWEMLQPTRHEGEDGSGGRLTHF